MVLGKQLPMVGVARAQRPAGKRWVRGTSGAMLKKLDSEGNRELLQGLEQGSERTVFICRWRPLTTERKKGGHR